MQHQKNEPRGYETEFRKKEKKYKYSAQNKNSLDMSEVIITTEKMAFSLKNSETFPINNIFSTIQNISKSSAASSSFPAPESSVNALDSISISFDDQITLQTNLVRPFEITFPELFLSQEPPSELNHPTLWKMYDVTSAPGLFVVKNVFRDCLAQVLLAEKCLVDFIVPDHPTNLTPFHGHLSALFTDPSQQKLLEQLRWTTLGYHYDWTQRCYHEDRKSPFPSHLGSIAKYVAHMCCGYANFASEAAIVNYYSLKTILHGHVDDSEEDRTSPIVSFSLGSSCIFLIGGLDHSVSHTPLYLQSGDVVIMSGLSRNCLHGVPRIIPSSFDDSSLSPTLISSHSSVLNYLQSHRINLNVR